MRYIKDYNNYCNEEVNWKSTLAAAMIGASSMLSPKISSGKDIPRQEQQKIHILSRVKGPIGSQPIKKPDLDLVHGILGSKRLDDDFESRVQDELDKLNNLGFKTDVSNIQVKTYIKGDMIITESSCDIIESMDGNSYNVFLTRGSIGSDFERRHDDQIKGLEERLESHYGGISKKIKTFQIGFNLGDGEIKYKQSFFVCSKETGEVKISAPDAQSLRSLVKEKTKGVSIDPKSIKFDDDKLILSYKKGPVKIQNLSLIFDNSGQLDPRLSEIEQKNPNMEVVKKGGFKNIEWCVLLFK